MSGPHPQGARTHAHEHTHLSPVKNHSRAVKLARGPAAPSDRLRPGVALVLARAVSLAGARFMSTMDRSVRVVLGAMTAKPVIVRV